MRCGRDDPMNLGVSAVVNIIISVLSIVFCYRVLLSVRIEQLLKVKNLAQGRILHMVLSIVLGHNVARFLIEYLQWSALLSHFVE